MSFRSRNAGRQRNEEKSRFSTEEEISRFARNDKREFLSNLNNGCAGKSYDASFHERNFLHGGV